MFIQEKTKIKVLGFLFLATIIVWVFVFAEVDDDILEIDFFDVGQGDGIFIEFNGKYMLIDGGPSNAILDKLGTETPFYKRKLDVVLLTHPEYDHITGLIEVIKRYDIGAIITTGVVRDTNQYEEFLNVIKDIPLYIAQYGGEIDFNGVEFNILYPFESLAGQKVSNTNNSSIVGRLVYNNFKVLFTGDIEKSVERKLLDLDLQTDVLKVAHHGSKTSSTEEFLKAVDSVLNVISAGKDNKYGHPHQEVLERMTVDVFVTGKSGDLEILSDGMFFKRN